MTWRVTGTTMLRVVLMVTVLVVAGSIPAGAADQAAVILNFEMSGGSCAQSSLVVSASSCDGQVVADALTAKMRAEGFSTAACGYSVNNMWECLFIVPSGCSLEDVAITLKPGVNCQVGTTEGWIGYTSSVIGAFAYNIQ